MTQPLVERLRRVASDIRNSKAIRTAALRQLRPLERASGLELAECVKQAAYLKA